MSLFKQRLALGLALVLLTANIGCGQGFKGQGVAGESGSAWSVDDTMSKAAVASQAAQKAMLDANSALSDIMDDQGNIKLNVFSRSAQTNAASGGLMGPLLEKLNTVFNSLFEKVAVVKEQFALARTLLNSAISKLNPSNPLQAAQIAQIRMQLSNIDLLEQQFSNSLHLLAGKLDLATNALDKLIQAGTSLIPIPGLGSVAGVLIDLFVTGEVKNYIASVKLRLLSV